MNRVLIIIFIFASVSNLFSQEKVPYTSKAKIINIVSTNNDTMFARTEKSIYKIYKNRYIEKKKEGEYSNIFVSDGKLLYFFTFSNKKKLIYKGDTISIPNNLSLNLEKIKHVVVHNFYKNRVLFWILSEQQTNTLKLISLKDKQTSKLEIEFPRKFKVEDIQNFFIDPKDSSYLWLATNSDIYKAKLVCDTNKRIIEVKKIKKQAIPNYKSSISKCIIKKIKKKIWIAKGDCIWLYDKTIQTVVDNNNIGEIRDFWVSKNGDIWIVFLNQKLIVQLLAEEKSVFKNDTVHVFHTKKYSFYRNKNLKDAEPSCITGNNNTIWIGTLKNGVYYIDNMRVNNNFLKSETFSSDKHSVFDNFNINFSNNLIFSNYDSILKTNERLYCSFIRETKNKKWKLAIGFNFNNNTYTNYNILQNNELKKSKIDLFETWGERIFNFENNYYLSFRFGIFSYNNDDFLFYKKNKLFLHNTSHYGIYVKYKSKYFLYSALYSFKNNNDLLFEKQTNELLNNSIEQFGNFTISFLKDKFSLKAHYIASKHYFNKDNIIAYKHTIALLGIYEKFLDRFTFSFTPNYQFYNHKSKLQSFMFNSMLSIQLGKTNSKINLDLLNGDNSNKNFDLLFGGVNNFVHSNYLYNGGMLNFNFSFNYDKKYFLDVNYSYTHKEIKNELNFKYIPKKKPLVFEIYSGFSTSFKKFSFITHVGYSHFFPTYLALYNEAKKEKKIDMAWLKVTFIFNNIKKEK